MKPPSVYRKFTQISIIAQWNESLSCRSQCELLETPFARRLDASLVDVLRKLRSIPGFLAQITLDLFNRQTMTVHR